jgi:hypothetical protein
MSRKLKLVGAAVAAAAVTVVSGGVASAAPDGWPVACQMQAGSAMTQYPDPTSAILGWAETGDWIDYDYSQYPGYDKVHDATINKIGWVPNGDLGC